MRSRHTLISGVIILGLILAGSGCQAATQSESPDNTNQPVAHTADLTTQPNDPRPDLLVSPTPVFLQVDQNPDPQPVSLEIAPTPLPDPLRFSFPSPAPPPVSAWRPPLYPIPWAPTLIDHFYFSRPIAADEINWPLAEYRYGGVFIPDVVHTGIDIPAPTGASVLAAGTGKVHFAGYGLYRGVEDPNDPYGLAVVIKHDFGFQGETLFTVYGHLSQIDVLEGQQVKTSDQIGLVGETGKVTGPHLHFEVRIGRNNFFRSRNPELWLAPPQGWGILVARIMSTNGQPIEAMSVSVRSKDDSQGWSVKTYSRGAVVSDAAYQENMVLGDLPAGKYEVRIPYAGATYNLDIEIHPGMVSYFIFRGKNGFTTDLPPSPEAVFTPPVEITPATP